MSQSPSEIEMVDCFFQTGGTLKADAPSYIERTADKELHRSVLAGDYCYILTPRQMGKSSLMTRTAVRLRKEGVHVAVVDLSGIGGDAGSMTADQWYYGLANRLLRELEIQLTLADWWKGQILLPPLNRLMNFFEDIILAQLEGNAVIFVDEIDTTIKLPFSDDFFAAVRACFNERANKEPFSRLCFVLLGVASPTELIRVVARTPFNIGKRIDLADFTEQEANLFLRGFSDDKGNAKSLLKRILHWTNGHPFLTQRLCVQVLEHGSVDETPVAWVDRVVAAEFLGIGRRTKDEHLKVINDRILQTGVKRPALLKVYAKVLKGKRVFDQPQSITHSELKLSGLVKTDETGHLVVRNLIYRRVFDSRWVKRLRPTQWKQRSVVGILLAFAIVFGWWIGTQEYRRPIYQAEDWVMIKPGTFCMGSHKQYNPASKDCGSVSADPESDDDESPLHRVTIKKAFLLAKHEVTLEEYTRFTNDNNNIPPGDFGFGADLTPDQVRHLPMVKVSWQDAVDYAAWLSRRLGKKFRLPTEAEWEYAARAGTITRRYWGDDPEHKLACDFANVLGQKNSAVLKSRGYAITWDAHDCDDHYAYSAPVGQFKPNAWGLQDMLGNVWEWVADCYHENYREAPNDGTEWKDANECQSARRVIRGGSWGDIPVALRSANRSRNDPGNRDGYLGFRLAQDL